MSKAYGTRIRIPYLHLRPEGFVWRRRLPRHLTEIQPVVGDDPHLFCPRAPYRSQDDVSQGMLNVQNTAHALPQTAEEEKVARNSSVGKPTLCPSIHSEAPCNRPRIAQTDPLFDSHERNNKKARRNSNHCGIPEVLASGLNPKPITICISLGTQRIDEAANLARQITILSNQIFTHARLMKPSAKETEKLLVAFGRVLVGTAEIARAISGPRSISAAELAMKSELALQDVLSESFRLRDFSLFEEPLAKLAEKLGISMPQEESEDAKFLAYEAARIAFDASKERIRRDHGIYPTASPYFQQAMASEMRCNSSAFASGQTRDVSVHQGAHNDFESTPMNGTNMLPPNHASGQADEKLDALPAEHLPYSKIATDKPKGLQDLLKQRGVLSHLNDKCLEIIEKRDGMTFEEASQIYCHLKSAGFEDLWNNHQSPDAPSGKNWIKSSLPAMKTATKIWTDLTGNCRLDTLSVENVDEIIATIRQIPKLHGKGEKYSSEAGYIELIARTRARDKREMNRVELDLRKKGITNEVQIEDARAAVATKPLRSDTFLRNVRAANRVGKMLFELKIISENPFHRCSFSNSQEKRMKATEENITRQKWDDRFLEFLASPKFQGATDGDADPLYWMPLIAYTMGLRSEEAAQLRADDFSSDKGVLYVKVRQTDGNRVKSEAGTRDVPVHPALIDLGLTILVDKARQGGNRRIFASLTRGATKGTFTENFTKSFNYFRRTNGVYWVGLDFHALRTTFHHHLLDNNCPGAHRRRLMGHEPLDEGERSYAQNGISIRTLYEHVRHIPFEVHRIRSPFHPELLSPHKSRATLSNFRVIENTTASVDYNQTHHI